MHSLNDPRVIKSIDLFPYLKVLSDGEVLDLNCNGQELNSNTESKLIFLDDKFQELLSSRNKIHSYRIFVDNQLQVSMGDCYQTSTCMDLILLTRYGQVELWRFGIVRKQIKLTGQHCDFFSIQLLNVSQSVFVMDSCFELRPLMSHFSWNGGNLFWEKNIYLYQSIKWMVIESLGIISMQDSTLGIWNEGIFSTLSIVDDDASQVFAQVILWDDFNGNGILKLGSGTYSGQLAVLNAGDISFTRKQPRRLCPQQEVLLEGDKANLAVMNRGEYLQAFGALEYA